MKKITLVNYLIAFLCTTSFFITESTAQNLIVNGDFEEGTIGDPPPSWEGFKNRIQMDGLTNDRVGQIENGDGSLFQVFNVTAGETYDVTFEYRWVDAGASPNTAMTVRFRDPNVSGGDGNLMLTDGTNGYVLETTLDEWLVGTFSITIPDGLNQGRLQFFKANGNKPINIDNVVVQLENTASVTDLEQFGYTYFPNPATDVVRLSASQNIDKVEVYNLNGKRVLQESVGNNAYELSVEQLNAGIYILKTQIGNAIGTHKLIVK